jgi:Ligand-gated ion channel
VSLCRRISIIKIIGKKSITIVQGQSICFHYSLDLMFLLWFYCYCCLINICSFAVAQEQPWILVKKFDYSQTFRTNVCDRQRQVYNGSLELPNALAGLNLTIGLPDFQNNTSQDAFFRLVDGRINIHDPGLLVTVMDEVSRRAQFQWRNTFGTFTSLNDDDGNKTWTDILLWSIHVFDISGEVWSRSIERISKGVSYPTGWYDSSIVLTEVVQPNDTKKLDNAWAFLNPFTMSLWFFLCGFVGLTGLLYWCLELLNPDSDEESKRDTPITCIYHAAMVVTGNFGFHPKTHASRFLSFSWTFWVLFVLSAYVANLASHLVTRTVKVYRIDSVAEALRQNSAVCVEEGASVESYLKKSYPTLRLVPKPVTEDIFTSLRSHPNNGGCDVAAFKRNGVRLYQRSSRVNYDCSLALSKSVEVVIPAGMATAMDTGKFRCTALISSVLDYHLLNMIEDGFIENVWNAHLSKVGSINCFADSNQAQGGSLGSSASSLELGDVSGLFWLHVVLSLTALLISLYPFIHLNKNNQNKPYRLASLLSTTPPKDVVPPANISSDILDENKHQDDAREPVPNILNHATS